MRVTSLIILLWGLTIVACNPPETNQDNYLMQDTLALGNYGDFVATDTISNLFNKALNLDSLEYSNWKPFIFFKSGNFLKNKNKNVLLVTELSDTTISVKLYKANGNNLELNSSVENLNGPGMAFQPMYHDFNFDGQTDIYIQVTASNGYSLSRGHLITIDPLTMKLNYHPEAREFANMRPDKKTHSVISEEVIECKSNLMEEVGILTNKWIKGQLKTIKKKYPCESLK